MRVQVGKTVADGDGAETAAPMDVPVDIGIFARGSNGDDEKVVYLARHDVEDGENIIELHVDEKPHEVGIDPYNKLIDRVAGDDRMKVVFEEEAVVQARGVPGRYAGGGCGWLRPSARRTCDQPQPGAGS